MLLLETPFLRLYHLDVRYVTHVCRPILNFHSGLAFHHFRYFECIISPFCTGQLNLDVEGLR